MFLEPFITGPNLMTLQSIALPPVIERRPGLFLARASGPYDTATVSDFTDQGLTLPKNLAAAVHKRKIEYLLGRLCIKRCFEASGETPLIVAMGEDRSPIWPKSWVGSVSHSKGQIVAVLGRSHQYAGLGIDLEALIDNPSTALQTQICSDREELEQLQKALDLTEQQALTLIFSSKESLYKLIFPRYRKFFGFQAARVEHRSESGLVIELREKLSDSFPAFRKWTVDWQSINAETVETLIAEPASV
jgi:enterobactin synthetase component D